MMRRSMPACTAWKSIIAVLLFSTSSGVTRAEDAHAAPATDDARARAGALFEAGVRQFEARDFAAAARTFLDVDETLPSARALTNALSAARRAGLPLLVVEAVRRSETRTDLTPDARAVFTSAMADATRNLARLDASCTPEPCALSVDGARVQPGPTYVEPGEHVVRAETAQGTGVQSVLCTAGVACTITVAVTATPEDEPAPPVAPKDETPAPPPPEAKPLPPWAFVAGAVGTAGLVALTTWSGLNTLSARDLHDSDPAHYDPDTVHSRARRTDALLAGSVLLGGATAVAGLFFVDWNGGTRTGVGFVPGGGAVLGAAGQF
jgi:hypothetical protein